MTHSILNTWFVGACARLMTRRQFVAAALAGNDAFWRTLNARALARRSA